MQIKKTDIWVIGAMMMAATFFPLTSASAEKAETPAETAVQTEAADNVTPAEVSKYEEKLIDPDTMKPCLITADWKPEVKKQLEDFLGPYITSEIKIPHKKNKGPKIKDIPYAILNLDETAGINKAQEQVLAYQLETLTFAMKPEKFAEVIRTGMNDEMLKASYAAENGDGKQAVIADVMAEAEEAYGKLYEAGAFNSGAITVKKDKNKTIEVDEMLSKEFSSKMLWLYKAINATQGADIAKPWAGYLYTGMTPYEVYNTVIRGIEKNCKPDDAKEVREMVKAIQTSGLDVWIVSSGNYDVVRACLNYYKVPGADGVLAMRTKVDKNGCYVNEYNFKYHPATYYKEGLLAAVKKNITGYYNAKSPAIIAEDIYDGAAAGAVNLCEVYPKTSLKVYFENREAVEAVLVPSKKK